MSYFLKQVFNAISGRVRIIKSITFYSSTERSGTTEFLVQKIWIVLYSLYIYIYMLLDVCELPITDKRMARCME